MKIFVSVAVTSDGCLDDTTPHRLMISSPEDWAEVHRLRAGSDAILVGAETLRRDNPSLLIRDPQLRRERLARGQHPDLIKVTLTHTGCLDPALHFFTQGEGEKIVFTDATDTSHLPAIATIIRAPQITAKWLVTELEKRGVERLFVEGGAQILHLFFEEGMVDVFRLATNPNLAVHCSEAPRLNIGTYWKLAPHTYAQFGGMQVETYTLRPDTGTEDEKYINRAIEVSRRCVPCATAYCVGAVVVTAAAEVFTGYTHETSPTHHAEQEAIAKALAAQATLRGATIYSSMEPCSSRKSEPQSCSELILSHGFARVVFALYEPDCLANCRGALNLREGGVEVQVIGSLAGQVREINAHIFR
ncbi:MAG: dihydrofolate reductase family protein [Alistipes sp.]